MKLPGFDNFVLGNVSYIGMRQKAIGALKEPVKVIYGCLLDCAESGEYARDSFDLSKTKLVIFNLVCTPQILVWDPEIVQEMFLNKNSLFEKTDFGLILLHDIF